MARYRVYVRNGWRDNSALEIGLEFDPDAHKQILDYVATQEEAFAVSKHYNDTHEPGRFSRRAEYTDA